MGASVVRLFRLAGRLHDAIVGPTGRVGDRTNQTFFALLNTA